MTDLTHTVDREQHLATVNLHCSVGTDPVSPVQQLVPYSHYQALQHRREIIPFVLAYYKYI